MQINSQSVPPALGGRALPMNRGQERGRLARKLSGLPPCRFRNSRASRPRSAPGYALLITLVFLVATVLIFAGIFSWTSSNARVTVRNNQYNMSENAAEAGVETVISRIDRDFINLSISNGASAYTGLPAAIDQSAWPVQYTYSNTNGSTGVVSVVLGTVSSNTVPLGAQYSGLQGYVIPVDVYATAKPIGQPQTVPATIHESLQLANIPMFQFAIFYNVNLEIDPGQTMYIAGPVFCNQSIWEGSSVCTYANTVAAVLTNAPQVADPFALNYNGTGASTFALAGQPVNHVNALVMPIGTNNSPGAVLSLLALPPPAYAMGTAPAYSSNGIVYMANQADLVISNFVFGTNDGPILPAGTNFAVYYQDNGLTRLPYDFYRLTSGLTTNYTPPFATNIAYAGFTWLTNVAFYDWREGWNNGSGPAKTVQAVQINVTNFSLWITNTARNGGSDTLGVNPDPKKVLHAGHHLDSLYIYTSVPLTTAQLPAVRLANGAQLPNPGNSTAPAGFSVATPFPMYVWGNYNSQTFNGSSWGNYGTNGATTYTVPAALLGDAITILSPSWNDSNTGKLPGGVTPATVNAAMLQGIVASNPNISGNYSGGVENFLRLLEDWGGQTLTYNGSIVVLFYSQYATNSWQQTGNYYNPPTRQWSFDFSYQNAVKIPPLSPQSKALVRGSWTAISGQ